MPVSPRATARAVGQRLHAKSAALLVSLEGGLPRIMTWWFVAAMLGSALRIAASPLHGAPGLDTYLPYILLVTAPLLSMGLALHWFRGGDRLPQPATRLAVVGRWRSVPAHEARRHPLYGTSGVMVSLLVGMLLNVPVRALEYLAAMPALAGDVPPWLSLVDLAMQLGIAGAVASTDGLPAPVGDALHTLLDGNVKKVLISVVLWLPYLLLSRRVNVTFRHRVEG